VEALIGSDLARRARDIALRVYARAHDYAFERGFAIADTKFELGRLGDRLILIDECLTPDSSRFWPADQVRPGAHPESFDKQVVRDYLDGLDWNKEPPPPELPAPVLEAAATQYGRIYQALTGQRPW
jgi:phosphoribosylaminoimidazole-succinocarboxamide synthase